MSLVTLLYRLNIEAERVQVNVSKVLPAALKKNRRQQNSSQYNTKVLEILFTFLFCMKPEIGCEQYHLCS